jgi:hypothetical protein
MSNCAMAIGNWLFDPCTNLERTRLLLDDLKFSVDIDGKVPMGQILSTLSELDEELNRDSGIALLNKLGQHDVKKITRPATTFADKGRDLHDTIVKLQLLENEKSDDLASEAKEVN